jgi:hypothetical protein
VDTSIKIVYGQIMQIGGMMEEIMEIKLYEWQAV